MNILINDENADFSLHDLPILISGAEKTGSSFFTVSLLANLLKNGHKVILFSAYSAAKEEFRNQIDTGLSDALIIDSEKEDDFIRIIENTPNLSEIIVLIKNIDQYSKKIFEAVKDLKLIIFSGDLDKCEFSDDLLKMKLTSRIFFSYSEKYPMEETKLLPKYSGLIVSERYNGVIKLEV
jgi:hypothetical protein